MATKNPKAAGPSSQGFQVTARRASFWRAGLQFGAEARTVPFSELTEAQAEQIWAEGQPGGQLVVTKVDIPADKP